MLTRTVATVALEKSNLGSLRAMQHKDQYGNIISTFRRFFSFRIPHTNKPYFPTAVPDLSNPTRYRFERPLETIRSFEAAIDGSYNSRQTSYAPTGKYKLPSLVWRSMLIAKDRKQAHQLLRRYPFSRNSGSGDLMMTSVADETVIQPTCRTRRLFQPGPRTWLL